VPESTLSAALGHGSATGRVLHLVAAAGSVSSFLEVAGEFVSKDVAVARRISADLDGDLGTLDEVISAIGIAKMV